MVGTVLVALLACQPDPGDGMTDPSDDDGLMRADPGRPVPPDASVAAVDDCNGLTDEDRILGPITVVRQPDMPQETETSFLTEGTGTLCVKVVNSGNASARIDLDGETLVSEQELTPSVPRITKSVDDHGGLHTIGVLMASAPNTELQLDVFIKKPLRRGKCPFEALDKRTIGLPWDPPWNGSQSTDPALYNAVLINNFCGETGLGQAGYVLDYTTARLGGLSYRLYLDLTVSGGGLESIDDQVAAATDRGCVLVDVPTNAWNSQAMSCATGSIKSLREVMPAEFGLACRLESCPFNIDDAPVGGDR